MINKILNRNNFYKGENKEKSVDILFMPYHLEYRVLDISAFLLNKIIEPAFGNRGGHKMNSILIVKRKGIRKGYLTKFLEHALGN